MLGRHKGLIFLFVAFVLLVCNQRVFAENEFLIKYAVPDRAGKILVLGGESSKKIKYETTKLTEPARIVVDIKNAILLESKKEIKLHNRAFAEKVRIAQFSTEPNLVRAVFTLKSPNDVEKVEINTYRNSLVFEFEEIKLAKIKPPSVYRAKEESVDTIQDRSKEVNVSDKKDGKDTETSEVKTVKEDIEKTTEDKKEPSDVKKADSSSDKDKILKEIQEKIDHNITINTVELNNNRVLISGAGIISVTEPFVLDSPSRIIFDIADAVISSKELIKEFTLENSDTVRVAQFNNKTVRVVIETDEPELYNPVISPDLQSIIIASEEKIDFAEFPDNNTKGGIQKVKVDENEGNRTKLTIIAEKPIVHNIKRLYLPDRAQLELYNLKAPDKKILEGVEETGQFHGFKISSLDNYSNGSQWALNLNRSTKIESKLSLDGRILEITLKDDLATPIAGLGPVRKKILLDPGHGGYDPGAHRDGIFEKDIALDVAKRVKKYLDDKGFYTLLTREKDETVSLKERVKMMRRENPDLFVSLHVNASRNPNVKGIETHWYTKQSRPLAMHVQNKMVNQLVTPDRGLKNSRFYVLRKTKIPSVLAEIGYISNSIERYQLITEERKEATAKSIAEGIMGYIKSRMPDSSSTGREKL